MTGIDWSNCSIVQRDPEKLGGVPTVRAFRMSADQVVENWEAGVEPEEIVDLFGLSLDDVNTILAYAAQAERIAHSI